MKFSLTFFVIVASIIAIWIFAEIKRVKHKIFAIAIILMLLFFYFSFTSVFKNRNIDFMSIDGLVIASEIYFSWITSFFGNIKTITSNALKIDFEKNNSLFS